MIASFLLSDVDGEKERDLGLTEGKRAEQKGFECTSEVGQITLHGMTDKTKAEGSRRDPWHLLLPTSDFISPRINDVEPGAEFTSNEL